MELIRVYATSPTSAVAGAITGVVLEYHQAEVEAVGAEALDHAVQALALATDCLKRDGVFIACVPELSQVTEQNKVKTAIKFVVKSWTNANVSFLGFSANSPSGDLPRV
jgi:stage V sporulation protein S